MSIKKPLLQCCSIYEYEKISDAQCEEFKFMLQQQYAKVLHDFHQEYPDYAKAEENSVELLTGYVNATLEFLQTLQLPEGIFDDRDFVLKIVRGTIDDTMTEFSKLGSMIDDYRLSQNHVNHTPGTKQEELLEIILK